MPPQTNPDTISSSSSIPENHTKKQPVKRKGKDHQANDRKDEKEDSSTPVTIAVVSNEKRKKRKKVKEQLKLPALEHIVETSVGPMAKGKKTYQCKICMHSFGSTDHVKYHKYCKLKPQKSESASKPRLPFPFNCEICGRGFILKHHYTYHIKVHTGIRDYKCSTCRKGFYQLSSLKRHEETHLEHPFCCEICGKNYSMSQTLRAHIRTSHAGACAGPVHSCYFCDESCVSKKTMTKAFTTVDPFPYQCEYCGKMFKRKDTLNTHLRTHSPTPYVCSICSEVFKGYKSYWRHKQTVHSELWFKCGACEMKYTRKENLRRHQEICKKKLEKLAVVQIQTHVQVCTEDPKISKKAETLPQLRILSDEVSLDNEDVDPPTDLFQMETDLIELVLTMEDF